MGTRCDERLLGTKGLAAQKTRLGKPGEVRGVEVECDHYEQLREHRWRWLRGRLRVLALRMMADRSVTTHANAAPRGSCRVMLCCVHPCPEGDADGKRREEDARPWVALAEAGTAKDWHARRRRLFLPLAGSWHTTTALVAGHATEICNGATEDARSPAPVVPTHEQS